MSPRLRPWHVSALTLACWLASCSSRSAQPLAAPREDAAAAARPIAGLPASVVAPVGALTLYADYPGARGDRVDLYLVNRTAAAVKVPEQDGDIYAKLEVKDGGAWQRAQTHVYSDCGVSYDQIELGAGEFLRWSAYHPAKGSAATVRYKIYGDLGLISNSGPGHFDPAQREAARRDAMAMRDGDLAAIRAVLHGPLDGTEWERKSTRAAALRRLGELPAARGLPVVEELLAGPTLDDNEYSQAVRTLHQLSPARLAAWISTTLAGPAGPARERLLHELPFMPDITDPQVIADLIARARDPRSPDVGFLIDYVAEQKSPEVAALLTAITADPAYPEEVRIRARYDYEQWFGDDLVLVRVRPLGNFGDGHPPPVVVDIDLENTGKQPIRFAYTSPTEILSFYLTRAHGREQTFLPPRSGVGFFTPSPASPATRVELAPGQRHTIRIGVMDYFDLPAPADRLSVWVSCKLPGLHWIAQLGGGGAGINPRPR